MAKGKTTVQKCRKFFFNVELQLTFKKHNSGNLQESLHTSKIKIAWRLE